MKYSLFSLARNALSGHERWPQAWRSPVPRARYDVVIVGGGGHGLATAYYLARVHGLRNVAVLEKGWLGGGNTGRNTTIVRSNYLLDANARLYELSMKLWEGLSQELNFNVMYSPRGVLNLAHTPAQRDAFVRRGNAMRLNGVDAEWLERDAVERRVPLLNCSENARFPVIGGLLQPRGGTVRHDAVAWGYARAADALGVDIVQNCEVFDFHREDGRITGVETNLGRIGAERVGIAVAGHSGVLAAKAGFPLPVETHLLQAMVSEPVKPLLDTVVTYGARHLYISQSDKGELVLGSDLDFYPSYAQRGNLAVIQDAAAFALEMFPCLSRLRLMRHWAGMVDMSMDGSPILGKSPIPGLYLNAGWCYGGFKATPASGLLFAHTIANDALHPLCEAFNLERFAEGKLLDENGAGPFPQHH